MNGEASGPFELISMPPEHKLYVGEGIRSILDSIASIYLSKNIFVELFGEKLVKMKHQTGCAALAIYYRDSHSGAVHQKTSKFWRFLKINLASNFINNIVLGDIQHIFRAVCEFAYFDAFWSPISSKNSMVFGGN